MGFEPGLLFGRPCDLPGLCCEHVSVCVVVPLILPLVVSRVGAGEKWQLSRWVGRAIGLDVHRDFCVVAICEEGRVRFGARVPSTPEGLTVFAQSLGETDRVALEVTGSCWEVARILAPHVERVVAVSPDDTGITSARAKTDRLDARTLTRLLWSGELEAVWMPDELPRAAAPGSRVASNSCTRARGRGTRSTRSCSAAWRANRRARICSASRAAGGRPRSTCPSRSAGPSRRGSGT